MRMILLLAALLIVGLLVYRQLDTGVSTPPADLEAEQGQLQAPRVPTNPEDLPSFERDMNQFMDDAAAKQADQIEQLSN